MIILLLTITKYLTKLITLYVHTHVHVHVHTRERENINMTEKHKRKMGNLKKWNN